MATTRVSRFRAALPSIHLQEAIALPLLTTSTLASRIPSTLVKIVSYGFRLIGLMSPMPSGRSGRMKRYERTAAFPMHNSSSFPILFTDRVRSFNILRHCVWGSSGSSSEHAVVSKLFQAFPFKPELMLHGQETGP